MTIKKIKEIIKLVTNEIEEWQNFKEVYEDKLHEKLMEQFMKENPTVLDDDIPNKFDKWCETKGAE